MKDKIKIGFSAGFIGALILILVQFIFKWLGWAGNPGFIGIYHKTFGVHILAVDIIISAFLFAVSGGIWGAIFTLLLKPNILKGIIFGFAPSLWVWLVISPYMGFPIFHGFALKPILFPIIFNCLIWGSFVGWYAAKSARKYRFLYS
ncbi:MAG TPA: hypothetical protein VKA34_20165 [Balneolales bacterium]|nr:hypothetical protein [Balneolales bacterium]